MASGGTVHPASYMNDKEDAEALEKAMKGLGTDEQAIIDLLSKRSVFQRQKIAETYKSIYGKDLKDRLHSELSGHFRQAVLYSFYDMAHVNAKACYKAIKGAGTDEQVLIDVICTATNDEIHVLKKAYGDVLLEEKQNALRRNLELDVKHDTSGDFERVLIALLQGQRGADVSDAQLRTDCEELYKGGEAKLGTDETTFTRILVSRSWKDIAKINDIYNQARGHDLITAIGKETSGDYRRALQTIVKTAINRNAAYAEILYNTMKGAGTHDDNLVRMIIAHSEIIMSSGAVVQPAPNADPQQDAAVLEKAMKGLGTDEQAIIDLLSKRSVHQRQQIAVTYKSIYGKDLKGRLHSELSGHFRQAVLYSFYDMAHVNAKACYKAIKGAGTDEQVLIDVICTATNDEIHALKKAYTESEFAGFTRENKTAKGRLHMRRLMSLSERVLFEEKQNALRRNLELDVKNDTSGDFQRVLIALLQGQRGEDVSEEQIRADCEELYKGGEAMLGTDETTFTRILVSRSWKDIVRINNHYYNVRLIVLMQFMVNLQSNIYKELIVIFYHLKALKHDLIEAIGKETSGDYRRALQTIVKTAINRNEAYAEILYNTMKGAGTHDDNLVRMIIAHSECDHRFNWDETEVITMANTKGAREFLEACYSCAGSTNHHVDLDIHYVDLRLRLTAPSKSHINNRQPSHPESN
ncbi:unnamed protein product [Schistocephalus solidus]|uniref:Annexin n=1 Tax=Schistocephalus solidus TaxID=70667 RepID=A0A183SWE1_SCHSO|nr:unnamed protein product [Schistocephalus solidus]